MGTESEIKMEVCVGVSVCVLSFHKGSQLHQTLTWLLVCACFRVLSLSPSLLLSEASFALSD